MASELLLHTIISHKKILKYLSKGACVHLLVVLGIILCPLPSFSLAKEINQMKLAKTRPSHPLQELELQDNQAHNIFQPPLKTSYTIDSETKSFLSLTSKIKLMEMAATSMRDEIVFFDVETTVPLGNRKRFWMLEFGAILVCPRKLMEIESYCTLIRPGDLSAVSERSARCNGITRQAVTSAPSFEDVADRIFDILNGRVWAGHNIQRFDRARIKEAFADIGRPEPQPIGMIDSLSVLGQQFGKRAGNLKMATLATYFGLGQQKHRSLEDVRMNLDVLKHCATVLLLESSLPNVLSGNNVRRSTLRRTRANAKTCGEEARRKSCPASSHSNKTSPYNKKSKFTDTR